jgi:hypothetical protein
MRNLLLAGDPRTIAPDSFFHRIPAVKPIAKSSKLANIGYDIRGPVLDKARQM